MLLFAIEIIQDMSPNSLLLYATIGLESAYYNNKNVFNYIRMRIIHLIFGICCLSRIAMALGVSTLLRNIFHVNSRVHHHFLAY